MKRGWIILIIAGGILIIVPLFIHFYNIDAINQRESIRYCEVDEDCAIKSYTYIPCGEVQGCFNKNENPRSEICSSFFLVCNTGITIPEEFMACQCNQGVCGMYDERSQRTYPECNTFYDCLPPDVNPGLTGCGGCYPDENGAEICYELDENLCQEYESTYACVDGTCYNS